MKLFIRAFAVMFLLQLILHWIAATFHTQNPLVFWPIIPYLVIGMAIGGLHSAGFWSFFFGLVSASVVYAAIITTIMWIWSKLLRRETFTANRSS